MKKTALILAAAMLLPACILPAQDTAVLLEKDLILEAHALGSQIEQYQLARKQEDEALQRYLKISAQFDEAINESSDIPLFRRLETELAKERETMIAALYETAKRRDRGLSTGERIRAIYDEMDRAQTEKFFTNPLDGVWHVEIFTQGITQRGVERRGIVTTGPNIQGMQVGGPEERGTLELRSQGGFVVGQYRLDDGSTGSLKGTYAHGRLRLDNLNSTRGFNYTLDGTYDQATDEIQGTYQAVLMGENQRGSGRWVATRLPFHGR